MWLGKRPGRRPCFGSQTFGDGGRILDLSLPHMPEPLATADLLRQALLHRRIRNSLLKLQLVVGKKPMTLDDRV